jgi:hypothetical protein
MEEKLFLPFRGDTMQSRTASYKTKTNHLTNREILKKARQKIDIFLLIELNKK